MPKITDLPLATILDADDLLYAVVDSNSRRIPARSLSGRNLIINGSGRINQRGYVSGTATTGANQFSLDRWFVVTSGESLSFTGTNARRVMTATGGVGQVIEGANIVGGSYVLNWDGDATVTVNGTARAKGETFTLTANANVVVVFSSGTFTDVQLEAGITATPFELRSLGQELALCQRFYQQINLRSRWDAGDSGWVDARHYPHPVTMRATPSVTFSGVTSVNATSVTLNSTGITANYNVQSIGAGPVDHQALYMFSAELTS